MRATSRETAVSTTRYDEDALVDGDTRALWGLLLVAVAVTETGILAPPLVAGVEITLGFTAPDRLTAHAGCNVASFQVEIEPARLVVDDDPASSDRFCSDELTALQTWLTDFLVDDPEYTFTGRTLILTRGGTEIVLEPRER